MKKSCLAWILIIIFGLQSIIPNFLFEPVSIYGQEEELELEWLQNKTMDESLNIIDDIYSTDEILLKWNLEETGPSYTLTYPFKDGEKIEVGVNRSADNNNIEVTYGVQQYKEDQWTINTKAEAENYAEIDYSLTVPDWVKATPTITKDNQKLSFTIEKTASSQYPGKAFHLNNRKIYFKWDVQHNDFYLLIKGVKKGQVIPFTLKKPSEGNDKEGQTINILRDFNNFQTKATHWAKEDAIEKDYHLVEIPEKEAIGKPGTKPGIQISFEQPKIWDETKFVTSKSENPKPDNPFKGLEIRLDLEEMVGSSSIDLWMKLSQENEGTIYSESQTQTGKENKKIGNFQYTYDDQKDIGLYTIDIVKDKNDIAKDNQKYISWEGLQSSTLYNHYIYAPHLYSVGEGKNKKEYYFATKYLPKKGFAYTYLEYEIKRSSKQDAYLEILPYRGGEDLVEYSVYAGKVDSGMDDIPENQLWVRHYHDPKSPEEHIVIPVPFLPDSKAEYYQLGVKFAGEDIRSQVLYYKSSEDKNVPPPVPFIQSIENIVVVPPKEESQEEPSHIQFDIKWSAPELAILEEMLKSGTIYYELWLHDEPQEDTKKEPDSDQGYRQIQAIKIKGDEKGKITVTNAVYEGENIQSGFYNKDEKIFTMPVVLKDKGEGWVKELICNNPPVDQKVYTKKKQDNNEIPVKLEIPGIYFLKMRGVFVKNEKEPQTPDTAYPTSQFSTPSSISLTLLKHELPIPTGLKYKSILNHAEEKSNVELKWNKVDLSTYKQYMLDPLDLTIDFHLESTEYRILIAEDKKELEKKIKEENQIDKGDKEDRENIIQTDEVGNVTITSDQLSKLRDKKVLVMHADLTGGSSAGIKETLYIKGLDPNQVYYVAVQTRVGVVQEATSEKEGESEGEDPIEGEDPKEEIRISTFSKVLQIMTTTKPEVPGEDEKIPTAPKDFEIIEQPTNNSVRLGWKEPMISSDPKEKIEYEILRIPRKPLAEKEDDRKIAVEDMVSQDKDNYKAWKTFKGILYQYNSKTNTWEEIKDIEKYKIKEDQIEFFDDTLSPNEIYYYYVRTTRVQNEEKLPNNPIARSQWVGLSVTTSPVSRPLNLRVEPEDEYFRNAKTETVVSFDAPVPEDKELKKQYVIEVYVKDEDSDEDYKQWTNAYEIDELESTLDGYVRYVYRIRGLKSGKGYSIKVRIEDQTQTLEDGSYPKSSFSDRVRTRTDFDQEDYDKENKYKEYIAFYEKEAQKLKHTPFWILEDNTRRYQVKYRRDVLQGEMRGQGKPIYTLTGKEDVDSFTYYMPSSVLENMDMEQMTFLIQSQGMEIGIRPNTLDTMMQPIIDMLERVRTHTLYKDYYIEIRVDLDEDGKKVKNVTPQSPFITIDMDVVGSCNKEEMIEQYILDELDYIIESYKRRLIRELEKEIKRTMDDKKLVEIVEEIVEEVQEEHIRVIGRRFRNHEIDLRSYSIEDLSTPLYIAATIQSPKGQIQGYRYEKTLENISVYPYKNQYMLEASQTGTYFFGTGDTISPYYPSTGTQDPYQNKKTQMIYQFGLQEFYTGKNLGQPSTREILIGTTAKILGAPSGTNYAKWLQQKGYVRGLNGGLKTFIPKDEGAFILSQIYNQRTRNSIESLRITNYNQITDLYRAKESYRKSLLALAEMNILPLQDGRFYPYSSLTMDEALDIAVKLLEQTGW